MPTLAFNPVIAGHAPKMNQHFATAFSTSRGDFLYTNTDGRAAQVLAANANSTSLTVISSSAISDRTHALDDEFSAYDIKDAEFTGPLLDGDSAGTWNQNLVGKAFALRRTTGGVYGVNSTTTTVNLSCCVITGIEESTRGQTFVNVRFKILPAFYQASG